MKKVIVFFIVGIALISMVMLTGCNDDKEKKNEKADIQEILPAATKNALPNKESSEIKVEKINTDEAVKSEIDAMLPLFRGIGAYMCETKDDYRPYSDKFCFNSLSYVAESSKELLNKEYSEKLDGKENKIILTENAVINIAGSAFSSRMEGYTEDLPDEIAHVFKKGTEKKTYILNKPDMSSYTADIVKEGKETTWKCKRI